MTTKTITKKRVLQIVKKLESINYAKISIAELEKLVNPLLKGYYTSVPIYPPDTYIFRGRICDKPEYLKELTYPPKELVANFGRANDKGRSIFYGTIGKTIPMFELNPSEGDTLAISVWKTNTKMALNHVGFTDEVARELKSTRDFFEYPFADHMRKTSKENVAVYNYLAKVFTQKIPKEKAYLYKLSIAIANKLLGPPMQGIIYPTIAMFGNADNVALEPSFVDKHLQFVSVEFIKIKRTADQGSYDTLDSAVDVDEAGKLVWTGKLLTWDVQGTNSMSFGSGGDHWIVKDGKGKRVDPKPTQEIHPNYTQIEARFHERIDGAMGLTKTYKLDNYGETVTVAATLHLNLRTNEKFVSYYIPVCKDPFLVAASMIKSTDKIFEHGKLVHQKDSRTNEIVLRYEDFVFNNHVYIFSEVHFDFNKLPKPFEDPVELHYTSLRYDI
ncbi:MAG: hypothetical protein EPO58_11580 [Chitinophagaceae bacterium]|nr:MAG: hypothetical protein EPO58_11580 [Chitinophagaceae bacterium]